MIGGPDAFIKRVYQISPFDSEGQVVPKTLFKDLIPVIKEKTKGPIFEKDDGLCVQTDGDVWIVNDNDGVDDSSGEQLLFTLSDASGPPKCSFLDWGCWFGLFIDWFFYIVRFEWL